MCSYCSNWSIKSLPGQGCLAVKFWTPKKRNQIQNQTGDLEVLIPPSCDLRCASIASSPSAEGLFFSRLDSKLWTSGSSVEAAELSFQDVMFQVSVWANYTTTLVMHEKMLVDWRNIWTRGHNTWKNMGIPWGANTHVQERLSNGSKENSQLGNGTGSKSLVYRGTLSGDCIHTHIPKHSHTHTRTSLCFVFLTASYITTL